MEEKEKEITELTNRMVALTKELETSVKEKKENKMKVTVTTQAVENEIDHFKQTIKELEQ